MRTDKVLLILIVLMHVITLANITLLDGEWNGIAMWSSTILFVAAILVYLTGRSNERKAD